MRRFVLVSLLWCLSGAVSVGAASEPVVGTPQAFTLSNGLRGVVIPDHRAPVAVQMLWYKAGSIDEQSGKTGIAHMLEHLMFRGTEKVPAGMFAEKIARMGGQHNAFTNALGTGYFQKISRAHLADVMALEADRMVNLDLSEALFKPERQVVLEERHMRMESNPQQLFYEQLFRRHYSVSPYGNPVIGWPQDIDSFTLKDARTWYVNYYTPNNAVLILAGDITLEEGRKMAEKAYGHIPQRVVLRLPVPIEPERFEARRMVAYNPEAPNSIIYRLYRAPGRFEGISGSQTNDLNVTSLVLLARLLDHEQTGILHQSLVVDRKVADHVTVYYDPVSRGEVTFGIEVQPKPGIPLETVEKALDETLGEVITDGVTEAALARARVRLKFDQVIVRDDVYLMAYHMARWLICGGDVENFAAWQESLDAVVPADILRVARTYLRLEHSTTGVLVNTAAPEKTTTSKASERQQKGGL